MGEEPHVSTRVSSQTYKYIGIEEGLSNQKKNETCDSSFHKTLYSKSFPFQKTVTNLR